jgi:uncharacterized protein YwgA
MTESCTTSGRQKLLYLLSECSNSSGKIFGRKKLMKLAFFAEYFDDEEGELVSRPKLGEFPFSIYKFGPFSVDVMDTFDDLKEDGLLYEDDDRMQHLIRLTEGGERIADDVEDGLSDEEIVQIQRISSEFGELSGSELEDLSLDELGIEPRQKDDYRGMDVADIIDGEEPVFG